MSRYYDLATDMDHEDREDARIVARMACEIMNAWPNQDLHPWEFDKTLGKAVEHAKKTLILARKEEPS